MELFICSATKGQMGLVFWVTIVGDSIRGCLVGVVKV